jgi:hypothetical protein
MFAVLNILFITAIMIGNSVLVYKTPEDKCHKMEATYPSVSALYKLLEKYKKTALYFNSIFIARRYIVAIVYITMKDC